MGSLAQGKSALPLNQRKPPRVIYTKMGPVYAGTNIPFTGGATPAAVATPNAFAQAAANQQLTQQRQVAVAAQQKAEKRVTELEEELKGFKDAAAKAESESDVGFRTPLRTVSTAGSMGANLRIGSAGSRSRRAVRSRARGVSQLSTG